MTPTPEADTPTDAHLAWGLGDMVVRRIDEISLPRQTGPWLLPEATKEVIDQAPWLRPDFADSEVPHLASRTPAT
jgi:hypothetical protein